MTTFTAIGAFFEGLLAQAHFVSILLGLVLSTGFTQLAKYPVRLYFYRKGLDPMSRVTPEIEVEFHRWTIRLIAVLAGAAGTFVTWPDGSLTYRLVWSVASGLACPTLYVVVCHLFPWLGEKATADKIIDPSSP